MRLFLKTLPWFFHTLIIIQFYWRDLQVIYKSLNNNHEKQLISHSEWHLNNTHFGKRFTIQILYAYILQEEVFLGYFSVTLPKDGSWELSDSAVFIIIFPMSSWGSITLNAVRPQLLRYLWTKVLHLQLWNNIGHC